MALVTGVADNITAVSTANVGSALTGSYGTLRLAADGSYRYQANMLNAAVTVTDSFSYAISDGHGGSAYTTLVITVNGTTTPGSIIQIANPPAPIVIVPTVVSTPVAESSSSTSAAGTISEDVEAAVTPAKMFNSQGDSMHFELTLTGSIKNQLALENKEFTFRIPNGVFTHTNPTEILDFKATSPSGGPLPSWIHFDHNTKTFSGVPPIGTKSETVMVIVKDTNGREVRTSFTIGVNKDVSNQRNLIAPLKETDTKPKANKPQASIKHNLGVGPGKPSLTEQVHSVGKLSRLQESRALLDSLKQL